MPLGSFSSFLLNQSPASHYEPTPLSLAPSHDLLVAPCSPQSLCICLQRPPLTVTPSWVTVALVHFLLTIVLPEKVVSRQRVCAGKANINPARRQQVRARQPSNTNAIHLAVSTELGCMPEWKQTLHTRVCDVPTTFLVCTVQRQ